MKLSDPNKEFVDNILSQYREFLYSRDYSTPTIKNYLSDVRHLISWSEQKFHEFQFEIITEKNIYHYRADIKEVYKNKPSIAARRLSSLRIFGLWAVKQNLLPKELLRVLEPGKRDKDDLAIVGRFRTYLLSRKYSKPTIKNYLSDLRHLIDWIASNYEEFRFTALTEESIRNYRSHLKDKFRTKPSISARRLSSLRKFLAWAGKNDLVTEDLLRSLQKALLETPPKPVAPAPVQIIGPTFTEPPTPTADLSTYKIHEKIIHHVKNTRPGWYRRYHQYDWAGTLHSIILVLFAITVGSLFLYSEVIKPSVEDTRQSISEELGDVLAAITPPRVLSFQGRLTNSSGSPIITATNIVFKIYDARTGGNLLWTSKTWSVTPDSNGIFSVCLGGQDTTDDCLLNGVADTAIPATLFSENVALYLGVTVGTDSEMTPRQRIASVSYALNSDALEGFHGSQSPGANQVPILNASGNLAFAGAATISTGSSGALTLDSGSGTISLGSGDLFTTVGQTTTFTSSASLIKAANTFAIGASSGDMVQIDAQSGALHSGDITGAGKLIGVRSLFNDLFGNAARRTLASVRNFEASLTTGGFSQQGITITNYAGLWIVDPEMDGGANDTIINNPYGIYIEDFSTSEGGTFSTTPKAIYQAGTDDFNILAGQTRIGGTSNPTAGIELDITGDMQISGDIITSNLGVNFTDSDTNPGCASGEYKIYADTSETKLKKCTNGSISDLDTTGSGTQSDYISVTSNENSNASTAEYDVFEDGNYPGGTLSYTTNSSSNITYTSSTGRFASPNAGTYLININYVLTSSGVTSTTNLIVKINGTSTYTEDILIHSSVDPVERTVTLIKTLSANDYLEFFVDNTGSDSITANGGTSVSISRVGTGADLAEIYETYDISIKAGDVVSIDLNKTGVSKAITPYDGKLIGVVSTNPNLIIGGDVKGTNLVAIALSGRVPVKVSTENGPIKAGDTLTSSSTPGVAMKATQAGYVIGRALTGFAGDGSGTVIVFVNTHYSNPAKLNQNGDLGSIFDWDLENKEGLAALEKLKVDKANNLFIYISKGSRFIWSNSTGKALAWVSDTGVAFFESIETLVATVRKLIIKDEVVLAKEANISGTAKFDKDSTEVKIKSDKVTDDSLIYVTPTTKTDGLVLYVKEINDGESFVVALDQSSELKKIIGQLKEATPSASRTVKFNWLIINQE